MGRTPEQRWGSYMSSLEACPSCHHVMHASHTCTVLNLKERIEELKSRLASKCEMHVEYDSPSEKTISKQEERIRELESMLKRSEEIILRQEDKVMRFEELEQRSNEAREIVRDLLVVALSAHRIIGVTKQVEQSINRAQRFLAKGRGSEKL